MRSALCVVDAGTAVKVDSVDAGGQHLGGLIAPGIHMMREALMNKTSDIAKAAMQSTPSLAGILANNTIGAVSRGAVFALAGMADRAAEVIEQSTGAKPKLFITGGDAGMITGTMRPGRDRAGSGAAGIGRHRRAAALGGSDHSSVSRRPRAARRSCVTLPRFSPVSSDWRRGCPRRSS